jgi:hypothetical protein
MFSLNWKSYFAARSNNKLGNKNTTLYTKAWSPNNDGKKLFSNTHFGRQQHPPSNRQRQEDSRPPQFQSHRRHTSHPTTKLICLLGTGANAFALFIKKIKLFKLLQPDNTNNQQTPRMLQ